MRYFVTGATSGVGEALCSTLCSLGHDVYGTGSRENCHSIDTPKFHYIRWDASKVGELPSEIRNVKDLDGLIHCAAMFKSSQLIKQDVDNICDIVNVNLLNNILLTRQLLPNINDNGHVIQVSSVSGLRGQKNQAVYSATKHAIQGFSDALRIEENKRFTTICPGGINTPLWNVDNPYNGDAETLLSPFEVSEVIMTVLQSQPHVVYKNITLYPQSESH